MENPQFTPQFVLPTQGQSKLSAEDFEIELNRPPFFVPFPGDQGLDNKEIEKTIELPSSHQPRDQGLDNKEIEKTIELPSSHQPRRHRVPPGERQNHLARRNILFEATIGRKYWSPDEIPDVADEIPDVADAPSQSTVINTGECLLFFYPDSFLTLFLFEC